MAQALSEYQIVGLATNIAFLKRLVEGQAFSTADLDTGLIERNHAALFPAAQAAPDGALALAAVALIESEKSAPPRNRCQRRRPVGPGAGLAHERRLCARAVVQRRICRQRLRRSRHLSRRTAGNSAPDGATASPQPDGARTAAITASSLGDQAVHGTVRRDGDMFHVFTTAAHYHWPITTRWRMPAKRKPRAAA
jgi:3-methylcrotonyl-CoA carboxylase alpha subunit